MTPVSLPFLWKWVVCCVRERAHACVCKRARVHVRTIVVHTGAAAGTGAAAIAKDAAAAQRGPRRRTGESRRRLPRAALVRAGPHLCVAHSTSARGFSLHICA